MAIKIIAAIIPTIIGYTIRPLGRQVSYVIFYKSNLKDLRSTLKKFDAVKVRMKHAVEEVERSVNQKVEDDVLNWQTEADKITREAEELLEDEGRAKTKCLYICPNLISYHQLSRKSTKLVRKIEEHENKKEFASISYNAPVEDIAAIASDEYMAFESRTSMVKDIITELKKPDINRIGVYGLGGVGKTTLAKEVYREAMEEKLFDDVVIILNVKEKKDNETIQKAITKKLRMDVDESMDMGTRANLLRARIKDGKPLVILDDVLEKIDFEAMGLVGVPNCKLLLTSRERQVLFHDMRTQKNFEIGFLKENESWSLFEKMAGNVVKDNRILKEATQLAKKCGGLPVLVVAVASALRESSLEEWKDALRSFKRFDKKEMNEKAFLAIKWSYEQLEDQELKQLFLLCGSGSNYLSDLLKYSMGLGLIKNVETVEEARNSLNRMVKKLKNYCLLLDSYDDDSVRMHELVRDVAVRIASDDQKAFSKADGDEVKEWPSEDFLKKCTSIFLRRCKIPRLPEVPWECPDLKLLFLSNNNVGDPKEIPSNFFEGMKELKVLDVTAFSIESLPPSLQSLKHLQTLCLDQCELEDITLVGRLTNLKILSLIYSKVKELPKEIGQLTKLQLLDLTCCSELVLISPDVISSLTRLEELRMGIKSFKQWEGDGPTSGGSNATVSELKHLVELTALDIHVPDANLLPADLFSDKLERYTILIGDCWAYPDIHPTSSNMLKLKITRRNQFDQGMKLLVKKCEQLYLDGMEIVNIISYLFDSEAVNQLKHFHVQNNDKVKYVINSVSGSYSHNAFSNLESLALEDLVSLESVCYGQLIGEPFPKLKSLRLRNLPKLIGFSSKGKQLTIATEADKIVTVDEVGGPSRLFNNGEVSMPNLTTLIVHQCDSLRFLFSSSMAKSLRQLKHLKISKCQTLQAVYDTSSAIKLNGFECLNLNSVEIDSCDSLKNIFPASMAKYLKQLRWLKVENCRFMEEVVAKEGLETTYEEFGFPKVNYMMFNNLPQLQSFYPALHVSNWPSLNVLNFTKCGGVEIFAAEFSTYQDKLELGHSTPMKQPFFLIEKGKSFLDLENLTLDVKTEIWYEPYGPLLGELLRRKLKSIEFATSHPKSDVFFENLQNIEDLRVLSAPWKELIVQDHQGSSRGEIHEVETLPYVKLLWLIDMPELIHLGKENFQPGDPVFPNLEFLCVHKCGRLENLASTLISFQNLTTLNIWSCHGLRYLIPYSVAKNLQQLKKLVVDNCQRMVEIVASNGDDPENEITFSSLQHLELSDLPSLQGFCKGNCIFKVPPLKTFIVKDCHLIELTISPDGLLQSDPRLEIAKETDDEENDRDQTPCFRGRSHLV
ncbi:disease resistance protein [Pyrus ussuriensis x Pyrus communis]|uniref:Disease resistance protein n=1 Tax=Pyrus ussuriensis x Pyrus communis TaxID=2448454 RepID=A0A5N5GA72_9ROSA|nr:disease resistance protein [Pyrus ussuriensis x Pyrus communis]